MPRTYIFVGPAVSFTNRSNLSFLRNVVKSLVRKIYRILYISYLFFLFTEVSLLAVPLLSNDAIFFLSFQKMLSSLKLVFELSKAFLTTVVLFSRHQGSTEESPFDVPRLFYKYEKRRTTQI